ncbi:hypothetical protein [Croceicoccus marinus]|uniref:Uncharacterized protein n=1 Tax=Croceicoccus marinus TaxID=450378 RepID=A0A7G6W158_9SPHN|nr:hypothetical protein [Croceicoccus marinus]QNE07723.1 hypothetical protein H4O24_20070 [Croceicoccus marinus]
MQRMMGASNLSVLNTSSWFLAGLAPIALALNLSGAERAADQVAAYILFGAVGIFSWMALANLRSGVSRTFRVVYHGSANALISPVVLIAMAGCMTLAANSIDKPRSDLTGATTAPRPQSLPSSRG